MSHFIVSKSCGRCGPRGSTDSDRKPFLREDGGCAPLAVTSQHRDGESTKFSASAGRRPSQNNNYGATA